MLCTFIVIYQTHTLLIMVKIFIFSFVNTVYTHCLGTTYLNDVVHLAFKICKGNLRRPDFSLRKPHLMIVSDKGCT